MPDSGGEQGRGGAKSETHPFLGYAPADMDPLVELKAELTTIHDLLSAAAVLEWDQSTYMPSQGAAARGRQLALLGRIAHERRTAPRMGTLLAAARAKASPDSVDEALVFRAERNWRRASQVPAELMQTIREHGAATYVAWAEARKNDDFAAILPMLEKNVELSRRYSDCFTDAAHPADPFIDEHDPGMTTASVRELFTAFRAELVPIAKTLLDAPSPDVSFLQDASCFPPDRQLELAEKMARALGYDFERGRQDLTHHPFMIRFSAGDIRITTRIGETPLESLFGTIHETGHALYEQQIDPAFDGGPLGEGTSAGVHESQSRLFENLVARSRPFWDHFYPTLQQAYPDALTHVDVADFHRAINRVKRSLIRVEADEVTYNLHVMLRFDLETQMLEGKLAVKDLPEAWNARMKSDLGIEPKNHATGCMQDVHWYCTTVGGTFQGYTIGNLMSGQFFAAARRALPELDASLAAGDVAPIRDWLKTHVHQHGARYLPADLVERATGAPLSSADFVAYLKTKYGALYGVTFS